jgi:hypothetical protein
MTSVTVWELTNGTYVRVYLVVRYAVEKCNLLRMDLRSTRRLRTG